MSEKMGSITNADHGNDTNIVRAVIDYNWHLSTRALEALLYPLNKNLPFSHRESGDDVCGLDLGTAHAHKRSNENLCRERFKISGSHCRSFDLPELSGDMR